MTRKHFELIAAALRSTVPPTPGNALSTHIAATHALMDALASVEPRFDRDRFNDAVYSPSKGK